MRHEGGKLVMSGEILVRGACYAIGKEIPEYSTFFDLNNAKTEIESSLAQTWAFLHGATVQKTEATQRVVSLQED